MIGFFFGFLIFLLTFIELFRKLDGGSGFLQAKLAFQQTPYILIKTLPLVSCFSATAAILQLTRGSEMISAKAAGVSLRKIFFIFGLSGATLGAVITYLGQPLSTEALREYRIWETSERNQTARDLQAVFRQNNKSVLILTKIPSGVTLDSVPKNAEIPLGKTEIYKLDKRDLPAETYAANKAFYIPTRRTLAFEIKKPGGALKPVTVTLPEGAALSEPEKHAGELTSFFEYPGEVREKTRNDIPAYGPESLFYDLLTQPILYFLMTGIAVIFAPHLPRRSKNILFVAVCVIGGLILYALNSLSVTFAATGTLPPLIAVIFPKIFAFSGLMYLLFHREYGK